jgi:hypothetical protein
MSTGFYLFWDPAPEHADQAMGVTGWVWLKGPKNSRRLEQALNQAAQRGRGSATRWVRGREKRERTTSFATSPRSVSPPSRSTSTNS